MRERKKHILYVKYIIKETFHSVFLHIFLKSTQKERFGTQELSFAELVFQDGGQKLLGCHMQNSLLHEDAYNL